MRRSVLRGIYSIMPTRRPFLSSAFSSLPTPGSTASSEVAKLQSLALPTTGAVRALDFFTTVLGHRIRSKDPSAGAASVDGGVGADIEYRERASLADDHDGRGMFQPLYPMPVIATSNLRRVLRQAHAKNWVVAGGGGVRLASELRALESAQGQYRVKDESVLRGGSSRRRAYGDKDALEALQHQEPTAAVLIDPDGAVHLLLHAFARSPLVALRVPADEPKIASDFYESCIGLVRQDRAPALLTAGTSAAEAQGGGSAATEASAAAGRRLGAGVVSLSSSEGAAGRSRLELFQRDWEDPLHQVVRELLVRELGGAEGGTRSEQEVRARCDGDLSHVHPGRAVAVSVPSASVVFGRVSRREEAEVDVEGYREGRDREFLCIDPQDVAVVVRGQVA